MVTLKRILVAHDFSETSTLAVDYAVSLTKSFGSELTFLYVRDPVPSEVGSEVPFTDEVAMTEADRERLLTILPPADRTLLNPHFYVRAGTPAAEVVRFAAEHGMDLIVMGTHGRGFVGHMVMGSVAEKVVRTAPCPVLTVRNPGPARDVLEAAEAARGSV